MKILFFPFYAVTPHLETDLELMQLKLDAGHEVHVIVCEGQLKTCFNNYNHRKSLCTLCKSRVLNGLKALKGKVQIHELPTLNLDFSFIPSNIENVDSLMEIINEDVKVGLGAASTLIFRHQKNHKFDTKHHLPTVIRGLRTFWYLYSAMLSLLAIIQPDQFYFFNGRLSTPKALIFASQKKEIPFFIHERAGRKNFYILRKNTYPHDTNAVKQEIQSLWTNADPQTREEIGRLWFEERRKGIEQSWYSFTKNQDIADLPADFDGSKHNIVIYNSTIEEYYTLPEFQNFPIYQDEIEGIQKITASLSPYPDYHIFLRIHPNLKGFDNFQTQSYKEFNMKYPNLTVIPPESRINSYHLMDAAEKVISFGSTVGIEANYWGRPAILASSARYEDLGCVYRPQTHNELIDLLLDLGLSPKKKETSLPYGYWEKNYGIPFQHFKQIGLDSGKFREIQIVPEKKAIVYSYIQKIVEKEFWDVVFHR